MPLTEEQVQEQLSVLRIGCDPKSPFFKKVNYGEGLLSLPLEEQWQVFGAMNPELKKMVDGYMHGK